MEFSFSCSHKTKTTLHAGSYIDLILFGRGGITLTRAKARLKYCDGVGGGARIPRMGIIPMFLGQKILFASWGGGRGRGKIIRRKKELNMKGFIAQIMPR